MLNLSQIEQFYPEKLCAFRKNILREYLQYKILEIIFDLPLANKLSFLGGTALRIIYGNQRFSEDLDFDNFGLSQQDFLFLTDKIRVELEKQGYLVEIRNVFKGAYRCYIKLPGILFDNQLSKIKEQKIIIQIDTAAHQFNYQPDRKILNKFDVFTQILVTPLDILLSQKIYAILNRRRPKGRDFFDVIFLLQKTKPNYKYLKTKIGIANGQELKKRLVKHSANLNFNIIIRDLEPFLFNPADSQKIKLFSKYIQQIEF